jgi:hypothetical protein
MDPSGYYEKFKIVRNDTGEEITEFRFVLIPGPPSNDPHARVALRAYADSCDSENSALARELRERLDALP